MRVTISSARTFWILNETNHKMETNHSVKSWWTCAQINSFIHYTYNIHVNFMYCIERRRKTKNENHCLITRIATISHTNSDSKWEWNVWNRETAKVLRSCIGWSAIKSQEPRFGIYYLVYGFWMWVCVCVFLCVSVYAYSKYIYVFSYHGVPSDAYSPTIKRRKEKKKREREKRITWKWTKHSETTHCVAEKKTPSTASKFHSNFFLTRFILWFKFMPIWWRFCLFLCLLRFGITQFIVNNWFEIQRRERSNNNYYTDDVKVFGWLSEESRAKEEKTKTKKIESNKFYDIPTIVQSQEKSVTISCSLFDIFIASVFFKYCVTLNQSHRLTRILGKVQSPSGDFITKFEYNLVEETI